MNCIHPTAPARGHVQVAAVVGLDLVDRRQHLPAHAVLDPRRLVDRQQERRHPELPDDEVRDPGWPRTGPGRASTKPGFERAGEPSALRRSVDLRWCRCLRALAGSGWSAQASSFFARSFALFSASLRAFSSSAAGGSGVNCTCLSHTTSSGAGGSAGGSVSVGVVGEASVSVDGGGAGLSSAGRQLPLVFVPPGVVGTGAVSVMVSSDSSSWPGSEAGTPSAVNQPTARRAHADTTTSMRWRTGGADRRDGRTGLLVTGRSASPPAVLAPEGGMLADSGTPRKSHPRSRRLGNAFREPRRGPIRARPRGRGGAWCIRGSRWRIEETRVRTVAGPRPPSPRSRVL